MRSPSAWLLTPAVCPPGFPYEKVVQRTLYLQVLDYDRFSRNDPIGEVSIPLNKVDLTQMQTFWKDLKPCSDGSVRPHLWVPGSGVLAGQGRQIWSSPPASLGTSGGWWGKGRCALGGAECPPLVSHQCLAPGGSCLSCGKGPGICLESRGPKGGGGAQNCQVRGHLVRQR